MALRELALRFVADETEEDLLGFLVARHPDIVWDTAERIMVAVTGAPGTDAVLRRAARIAARAQADLHVVHVVGDDSRSQVPKEAVEQASGTSPRTWADTGTTCVARTRPRRSCAFAQRAPDHPDRARRVAPEPARRS